MNIFDNKPAKGTVVATLTPEEVAKAKELGSRVEAEKWYLANPNNGGIEKFMEVESAWRSFWSETIHKQFKIPYAWPVQIDYVTGYIYITE